MWWQRQRERYVYVFYRDANRVFSLPRSQVRHLDSLTDEAVDLWVTDWQLGHLRKQIGDPRLKGCVDNYCRYLEARGRAPKTVWEHRHTLRSYVLPFFLQCNTPLPNPNQWPCRSAHFIDYMIKKKKVS